MTFTSHGHHIRLRSFDEILSPQKGAKRCGGPGLCGPCSDEAELARQKARWDALEPKILSIHYLTGVGIVELVIETPEGPMSFIPKENSNL